MSILSIGGFLLILIIVLIVLAVVHIVKNQSIGKCGGDCSECTMDCRKRH